MTEKDWAFTVTFERAAGVAKTDGFRVTANGDNLHEATVNACVLYESAIQSVQANYPVLNERKP